MLARAWAEVIAAGKQSELGALREQVCARISQSANSAHDVILVSWLRRELEHITSAHPRTELASCMLDLARARHAAKAKFGDALAIGMFADVQGCQMATSALAGQYRAAHVVRTAIAHGIAHIDDFCCGIGGDSMAIAAAMAASNVTGTLTLVDQDPMRIAMAEANVALTLGEERTKAHACQIKGVVADVAEYIAHRNAPDRAIAVLDPARRDAAGSRLWRLADLQPGPEVVAHTASKYAALGIKLGPGISDADLAELKFGIGACQPEWLSEDGQLTQCVIWTGLLASVETGHHRATLLREGQSPLTLTGRPGQHIPVANWQAGKVAARYILAADAAPERAGLLGALCMHSGLSMLHAAVGLWGADALPPEGEWFTPFEVLGSGAYSLRAARDMLAANDAGIVEVKTRGGAVNPDQLQRQLRAKGDALLTLFVLRAEKEMRMIVARRVYRAGGQI